MVVRVMVLRVVVKQKVVANPQLAMRVVNHHHQRVVAKLKVLTIPLLVRLVVANLKVATRVVVCRVVVANSKVARWDSAERKRRGATRTCFM